MRTCLWVALGCAFWLFPLGLAIVMVTKIGLYEEGFGYNYDLLPLLSIPSLVTALTLLLGRLAERGQLRWQATVAASLTSVVAFFYWVAVWGQGV